MNVILKENINEKLYYLENKKIYLAKNMLDWGWRLNRYDRHVNSTTIGSFWISTVFLGLDHNMFGSEKHLFETMVFKIGMDQAENFRVRHCETWRQAKQMHIITCKIVQAFYENN